MLPRRDPVKDMSDSPKTSLGRDPAEARQPGASAAIIDRLSHSRALRTGARTHQEEIVDPEIEAFAPVTDEELDARNRKAVSR